MIEPRPDNLLPIGFIVEIGETRLRAKIIDHVYDKHALGGWGYSMQWYKDLSTGKFMWPHDCDHEWSLIKHMHPLEHLGMQAE